MALPPDVIRAVRKYGPQVNDLARQYRNPVTGGRLSGTALLAKLVQGESGGKRNSVSYAGARGYTQFMPGTRQAVLKKTGGKVDPWGNADDAVKAAVLHLEGDLGNAKGLRGYNPGMSSYTDYILKQKVGKIAPSRSGNSDGSNPGSDPSSSRSGNRTVTETVPGVDRSSERRAVLYDYFKNQRGTPGALVSLKQSLDATKDTPPQTVTSTVEGDPSSTPSNSPKNGSNATLSKIVNEADRIDKAKVPYLWGGGHSGKQAHGSKVTPLDCSGAVSRVLGIDPRVSGQFKKFGSPGRAPGGRGVTIYANDTHVLMEINGRFWGTSKSNPGGGAGWVSRDQITPQYLSRFTARHLKATTR